YAPLPVQGPSATATELLCVNGTFTGFPSTSCSGTQVNVLPSSYAGTAGPLVMFAAASSVDVYASVTQYGVNPPGIGEAVVQNFTTGSITPAPVPVPPSLILGLTGIVGAGLYQLRRRASASHWNRFDGV